MQESTLYKIEFAKIKDASEIAEMSKEYIEYGLGWGYTPTRVTKLIMNKDKNVIVARGSEEIIGFGIMTYGNEKANLDLLAVKRMHRRQRIGKSLVLWLEKVARVAQLSHLYVQSRGINKGAIKFYEKLGFEIIHKKSKFYRGEEMGVIMYKDLAIKNE